MSLVNARYDIQRILNSGGFEVDITLRPPTSGSLKVSLKGTHSNHHNSIDSEGLRINARHVSITISESDLVLLNYSYKKADKIYLKNHKVEITNANGKLENYVVVDTMPNYGLGVITCILANYDTIN